MGRAKNIIEATECAKRLVNKGMSRDDVFNYIREVYPLNWDTANQILDNCNFSSHNGAPDNSILKKEECVHISLESPAENSKNQKKNNSTKTFLYAFLGICALTGMFFIGTKTNTNKGFSINTNKGFPRGLEDALETKLQRNIQKRGINMLNEGGYPTIESSDGTTYFYAKCNEFVRGLYLTEKKGRLIFCAYKKEHNFQPPKDADILYLFTADLDFESKNVDVNPYKIKQNK